MIMTMLSDELYVRFRDLLLDRSGLHYPERKRHDLAHNLDMAMRAGGYSSFSELYNDVVNGQAWELLVEHLTIGETYFFRNGPQFDALRQHIVPEILRRRSALPEGARSIRTWSAGCASGEEPYSLAMMMSEIVPSAGWHVSILATDINPRFLGLAREGLYGEWSFRETSDAQRAQFFHREQNRWRVRPDIRRMVSFMPLNLAERSYPSITNGTVAMDLLLCRNVTIYFDEATTRQVVQRFYGALAPGGWLVVGHAEPNATLYKQFEVHNFPSTVIYRKPLDAPAFALDTDAEAPRPARFQVPSLPSFDRPAAPSQPPARPSSAPTHSSARPAAISQPPAAPPPDPWEAIELRLSQGDKVGAEPLLNQLLQKQPRDVKALATLARIQADRGAFEAAQRLATQALERDPLCIDAHYLLGQLAEHRGDTESALAAYRRTVYLQPSFIPGLVGMANIWIAIGREPDARRCYRNALKYLGTLQSGTIVPGTDDTTAAEMTALVSRQMEQLG
jgi:chemotaxis protein methyltransferase CheR